MHEARAAAAATTRPGALQRVGLWLVGRLTGVQITQTPAGSADARRSARRGQRGYAAARSNGTTLGLGIGGNSSADAELQHSLSTMRARSRQMVRDASYAKRAKLTIVNNIIGGGVGMQAQVMTTRNTLATRVNEGIEAAWDDWMCGENCHTGGKLHFHDLERLLMGQIFDAGEILVRKHYARFGRSRVPLALEIIEPERLAHEMVDPGAVVPEGEIRMGVEVDSYGRPLAYWIRMRHPGDIRSTAAVVDRFERVPAEDIFHLHITERWPQTRGEPWMHTAVRKVDDVDQATALELQAARGSAAYFATIENPDGEPIEEEDEDTGEQVMELDPLSVRELDPGKKLVFHKPDRPNSALDPFVRLMLREIAAGTGISYESLSRDYSQSNYSSSRMGLLEDRDLYRIFQLWWLRNFRMPLHRTWLQQAVLAGAVDGLPAGQYAADPKKFEAVKFKPRGWTWVDPTKEVQAFKEAVKAGFTTTTDVVAQTANGQDIEDLIKTRVREQQLLAEAGIHLDTTVPAPGTAATAPSPAPAPADPNATSGDGNASGAAAGGRVLHLNAR